MIDVTKVIQEGNEEARIHSPKISQLPITRIIPEKKHQENSRRQTFNEHPAVHSSFSTSPVKVSLKQTLQISIDYSKSTATNRFTRQSQICFQ